MGSLAVNRLRQRLAELHGHAGEQRSPLSDSVQFVRNVQNRPRYPSFDHFEQIEQPVGVREGPIRAAERALEIWGEAQDERAAIVVYDGKLPRAWAEGLARLHPDEPPADVPLKRWQTFVDDCARFLDAGWAEKVAVLGWGPLDLFGCDRERPFARVGHAGLLWLLNGDRLVELDGHCAVIERQTGVRQSYRRKPVLVGEVVLAWELADGKR
jgi:hypothetical protein